MDVGSILTKKTLVNVYWFSTRTEACKDCYTILLKELRGRFHFLNFKINDVNKTCWDIKMSFTKFFDMN